MSEFLKDQPNDSSLLFLHRPFFLLVPLKIPELCCNMPRSPCSGPDPKRIHKNIPPLSLFCSVSHEELTLSSIVDFKFARDFILLSQL